MNAHNEQHDPASPVVKQNLTTQPAAAQEAVGWFTDDYLTDKSATTYDPLVAERWRKKGWPVTAIYVAPVTAAPADLIERCREILVWQRTGVLPGDALRAYANARWPDEHDPLQIAEKETAREAFRILAMDTVESTPAAPGIDLQSIRKVAMPILCPMLCARDAESVVRKLHAALIDASPKGGSGCRYFCGGPEGHFFCDDLKLARDLVNAYDKGDDWTITDLQASDAEVRP